ncbi:MULTISPECIES: M20/M25/M40 family metallo-hydrolase [Kocuria]|jgi:acetylornithine deacetylase/succinyl-diaminopimelate desuccinylase-like protein|uniref:M20/M25/M40 family metallo-hydrolase n=1 Tax=Kocuria TaxID=57493 RepID=UPI00203AC7AA|nr:MULTISPECIES: M20/M25/M40 family metallo-hydrolase [Kocuria]MCM3688099.1 M20/M25/M40 family metallo-hydrolase [Kocuria rosea]HST71361.1 M20/M25/M40 family metallo-hydrolase [Kocuria rosea]
MTDSQPTPVPAPAASSPEGETVEICRNLIRIDTSNFGSGDARGERRAAEYVAGLIDEVGLTPTLLESAPGRANVFARLEGTDPSADALLVHGHLDVVPAIAADWSVDPFGGELADGMIWGRGAVDMKDMDAMMISVLRHMARTGTRPRRDIVFGFFADEEAGMTYGSRWVTEHHRELFDGVTDAISEVGGYSATIGGRRAYLLQTAEKGLMWLRLHAEGTAGHGSQINDDNPVTRLSRALANIGEHRWPVQLTKTTRAFLDSVTELTGVEFDPQNPQRLLAELGSVARFVGATLQTTANPTMLEAGYKVNVVPGSAQAGLDVRYLPEQRELVLDKLAELAGDGVRFEFESDDIALEVPFSGSVVDAMVDALHAEDPEAVVLPYMLSGGTDNKSLDPLGITGYGFVPLRLPDELDFPAMFHGVDERVPTASLEFGSRVLHRLLSSY